MSGSHKEEWNLTGIERQLLRAWRQLLIAETRRHEAKADKVIEEIEAMLSDQRRSLLD